MCSYVKWAGLKDATEDIHALGLALCHKHNAYQTPSRRLTSAPATRTPNLDQVYRAFVRRAQDGAFGRLFLEPAGLVPGTAAELAEVERRLERGMLEAVPFVSEGVDLRRLARDIRRQERLR